ncbi:prolyl-tRNA synthetase associated domain-containing protein [Candidatus Woesearchaeota archaeon]|nr:prolyl-tRNA synthetase associated domain-containing protein [Candidatus Woesearchaeota archaeon]
MEKYVEEYLKKNGIEYRLYGHPAVFTCEEAEIHCKDVPGMACKNLFLREKDTGKFFLVIMPASERLAMKKLEKILGIKKLAFAKEEELFYILKLTPGAVSPLGLVNDMNKMTQTVVDSKVWNADELSFHPNLNTESIALSNTAFRKLITSFSAHPRIADLD